MLFRSPCVSSNSLQLAKKYHPDANKADAETAKKFTEIGEAYQVWGRSLAKLKI